MSFHTSQYSTVGRINPESDRHNKKQSLKGIYKYHFNPLLDHNIINGVRPGFSLCLSNLVNTTPNGLHVTVTLICFLLLFFLLSYWLDFLFPAPACILEINPLLEGLFKYHTSGSYNNVNGKELLLLSPMLFILAFYICSKTKDYEL